MLLYFDRTEFHEFSLFDSMARKQIFNYYIFLYNFQTYQNNFCLKTAEAKNFMTFDVIDFDDHQN